jgi:hypothetical protein
MENVLSMWFCHKQQVPFQGTQIPSVVTLNQWGIAPVKTDWLKWPI